MKKVNTLFLSGIFSMLMGCMPVVLGFGDPDIYNGFKTIQKYQKPDTIGHTDVVQREKDVLACGVKNLRGGSLDLSVGDPGMTSEQVHQRMLRITACIKSKGYISVGPTSQCTKNGVDLGKCN